MQCSGSRGETPRDKTRNTAAVLLEQKPSQTGRQSSAPGVQGGSRRPTFGADEAPADVDVVVVSVGLLAVKVVGADNGGVGDHLAPRRHTQVSGVVRHGAAQAAH